MKNILLGIASLMIMSINIYAENNQTDSTFDTDNNPQSTVLIKTVRGVMGQYSPLEHERGQLRAGYITFKEDGSERNSAYALG